MCQSNSEKSSSPSFISIRSQWTGSLIFLTLKSYKIARYTSFGSIPNFSANGEEKVTPKARALSSGEPISPNTTANPASKRKTKSIFRLFRKIMTCLVSIKIKNENAERHHKHPKYLLHNRLRAQRFFDQRRKP